MDDNSTLREGSGPKMTFIFTCQFNIEGTVLISVKLMMTVSDVQYFVLIEFHNICCLHFLQMDILVTNDFGQFL